MTIIYGNNQRREVNHEVHNASLMSNTESESHRLVKATAFLNKPNPERNMTRKVATRATYAGWAA